MLLVAAVIGLRVYNAFALLASGEKVDLGGGREMFVACEGSGSPTILLEHGLGSSGAEWQEVQDRLAETNRVCWRSRAGQGFSDPHPGEGSGMSGHGPPPIRPTSSPSSWPPPTSPAPM